MIFLNRYTCTPRQLGSVVQTMKNKNIYPIIDYVSENNNNVDRSIQILRKALNLIRKIHLL